MPMLRNLIRLAAAAALVATMPAAGAPKLPKLGADAARVTVSGLSSGGFMAVQYATAHSASVTGVGVVAGGPYNCAFVTVGSIVACMTGAPSGAAALDAARGFGLLGAIDPPTHIAAQKVYLFSGTKDAVVAPTVMNAVRDFYRAAGVPDASLRYVNTIAAGHAFIATGFGGGCAANAAPYIDECVVGGAPYDQPAAILSQLYGPLKPKAAALSAKPVAFDQTPFGGTASGMDAVGYVFVPAACRAAAARCAVHVVFHGCLQGAQSVGDDVYARVGFNQWADANGIVVLYPQVDRKSLFNPQGCWDWWGYSGLNFQTQGGAQIGAVHAMIARLTAR